MAKHAAIPTVPRSTPAIAGPTIRAALKMEELRAMAFVKSSGPTNSTAKAWRVGMSNALTTPRMSARAKTCQSWIVFVQIRMAVTAETRPNVVWVMSRVVRLGNRSAATPPNNPNTSTGANWQTLMSPSIKGEEVSERISHDWARVWIQEPVTET